MEQKIYKQEIMLCLMKGNKHLRQIAKELNTNHMTIKRALKTLVEENILDVKKEGRNSVFSLKKTSEAYNAVLMAEIYAQNKLLKKHPELKQDVKLLKEIRAWPIVIFGSYAKGSETKTSDIDIYIDTKNSRLKEEAEKINDKFSVKIGGYDKKSLLIKEIEKNHIIVKGIEAFYEKNQFFE